MPDPQEQSIFIQALERDAGHRGAFLDEACASDPALRARVERLLHHHEHADSFLAAPAVGSAGHRAEADATVEGPLREGPGTAIGPYKLLEQIGEGGMGVVFLAEQTRPVRRQVALKVIKAGMDTRQVIARFEAERQALAMMDHVNIARVLDAGATDSGLPYFVMELVHGVPITKYCDDNHLTPRQRLELFVPVCQAIQHAHQKGIIHRDLKPSNVMITLYDGKPVPKVIDFGVAKATEQRLTERTLFTQYGTMVGTFEYMSPEQAEMSALGADTRSDIFSLGVLMYELLTGSTPLSHKRVREAAYAEVLRMIKEEEPPKPSTRLSDSGDALASISAQRHMEPAKLTKLVRGELDWIVMKCLEKDRNRRYETANNFAADVQRYLNDEPVRAVPPSAGYRLRKFARRNKRALAMASVIAVALLLAVGSLGWTVRDRAARDLERARNMERAVERAELLHQQGKRGEAVAALERAQLLARETEPAPALSQRIVMLQDLIDAEARDQQFVGDFGDIRREEQTEVDPEKNVFATEKGFPKLREALGRFGIEMGITRPADAVARIKSRPSPVQTLVVAALDECFQFVPGEDAMKRQWLIEVLEQADADPWRREVRQAWPNSSELERLVRNVKVGLHPASFVVMTIKRLPAKSPSRLDLARRVQRAYPDDFWANHRLGMELKANGNSPEALHYLTAALALQPRNPGAYLNRALAFEATKNLSQALADINQAIDLAPRYAVAWRIKGRLLQEMDPQDAKDVLRQALLLDPKDVTERSRLIGQLTKAGHALVEESKLDEAVACFQKVLELDPKDFRAHHNLGHALHVQQKLDAAIASYKKAVELEPNWADGYTNLGVALFDQKKPGDAVAAYRKAIELDPKSVRARGMLGRALKAQGKLDELIEECRAALRLEPDSASARDQLASALNEQAWALATGPEPGKRDPGRAVALAKEAVELAPKAADIVDTLGVAQYRLGNWKEAASLLQKHREMPANDREWTNPFFLAMAHWQLGNKDEALQWHTRAVEWMKWKQANGDAMHRARAEAEALMGRVPPQELAAARQRRLDGDLAGLSRDVQRHPGSPDALGARAIWLLAHGRFAEAERDYARLVQLHSADYLHWYHRACLLAYLGREKDYREHCRAMLGQFADPPDRHTLNCTTKASLLLPDGAGGAVQDLVRRAERAHQLDPESPWSALLMGLGECRAGRYEQAAGWLEKYRTLQPDVAARTVAADAYLAIARHRLGQEQEARAALERAARRAGKDLPPADSGQLDTGARGAGRGNWLIAQTALREAEATVLGRRRPATLPATRSQ